MSVTGDVFTTKDGQVLPLQIESNGITLELTFINYQTGNVTPPDKFGEPMFASSDEWLDPIYTVESTKYE